MEIIGSVDGVVINPMRIYIKKQILNLLDTVTDGIHYMMKNTGSNYDKMLDNCTNAILSVERAIQKEGITEVSFENKKLLNTLFSMKSCLYIDTELKSRCSDAKAEVHNLKLLIQNQIKTQLEIAFFPYKSSMWDCMDSIWRAAVQDQDCKCFVIPIPYYTMKSGVKSESFYEGNNFPNDVPILQCSDYDVQKRHPDIIYFHNPYDQANLVTQVDKNYFSSQLSRFTDMLVYVPYFVYGASSDKHYMASMISTPGIMHADKIIVQSENQKKIFAKFGLNTNKMIVAGSPKFDAVLKAEQQYQSAPERWKDERKHQKIFLWNSALVSFLNDAKWFEKSELLISTFSRRQDCMLIWRPHPLLEATIRSIRPMYWERYIGLKEKILSQNNVVLDQNSDAGPAIAASDALISDYSSIMFQYAVTGKPILCLSGTSAMQKKSVCFFDYFKNYFLEDGMSLEQFQDMVLNGEDPKRQERLRAMKRSVVNLDGTCGQYVHNTIKQAVCHGYEV